MGRVDIANPTGDVVDVPIPNEQSSIDLVGEDEADEKSDSNCTFALKADHPSFRGPRTPGR